MRTATALLSAALAVIIILFFAVSKSYSYDVTTVYTVNVHADGTGSWVVVQSAYLQTQDDQTSFEQNISQAVVYLDIFASKVGNVINEAYNRTGRSMAAENVAVGGNVTESGAGAYGFLVYSFDWKNFASVTDNKMSIGDAFSNESFLFGEGELTISLPSGYTVESYSPQPDHLSSTTSEWNNVSSLQMGQPQILLSETQGSLLPLPLAILFGTLAIVAVAVLVGVRAALIRRKKTAMSERTSLVTNDDMEDTERIITLLKSEGGQIHQTEIAERLRFSKAKTSKILGEMEGKGIIRRFKRGRDKVVSLQELE